MGRRCPPQGLEPVLAYEREERAFLNTYGFYLFFIPIIVFHSFCWFLIIVFLLLRLFLMFFIVFVVFQASLDQAGANLANPEPA